jgi:hypothetical protein
MPKARKLQICTTETPYYHLVSRCVRRAFLCGSSETYHRKIGHPKNRTPTFFQNLTLTFLQPNLKPKDSQLSG